jgi:hypothetical protein
MAYSLSKTLTLARTANERRGGRRLAFAAATGRELQRDVLIVIFLKVELMKALRAIWIDVSVMAEGCERGTRSLA